VRVEAYVVSFPGSHTIIESAAPGLRFRVYGLGFRVWGLGFKVWDLVFRVGV